MWRVLFYKIVLSFFKTDKMEHHRKLNNILSLFFCSCCFFTDIF